MQLLTYSNVLHDTIHDTNQYIAAFAATGRLIAYVRQHSPLRH